MNERKKKKFKFINHFRVIRNKNILSRRVNMSRTVRSDEKFVSEYHSDFGFIVYMNRFYHLPHYNKITKQKHLHNFHFGNKGTKCILIWNFDFRFTFSLSDRIDHLDRFVFVPVLRCCCILYSVYCLFHVKCHTYSSILWRIETCPQSICSGWLFNLRLVLLFEYRLRSQSDWCKLYTFNA